MKKKLGILFLALMILFTSATAFAVTIVGGGSNNGGDATESAVFLLSSDGGICGLTAPTEKRDWLPMSQVAKNIDASRILSNGKVVRVRLNHQVELDDVFQIMEGGSEIACSLQVISDEVLDGLGLFTAGEVVDATISATRNLDGTYTAFHRFLDTDAGSEVARIHVGSKFISVRFADWDGNGSPELCLRAGSSGNSGGSGPAPALTPAPTQAPTMKPTQVPTVKPTQKPTQVPTVKPTQKPTQVPTVKPTQKPTQVPTVKPTIRPGVEGSNNSYNDKPEGWGEPTVTVRPTEKITVNPTVKSTPTPTPAPGMRPGVEGSNNSYADMPEGW